MIMHSLPVVLKNALGLPLSRVQLVLEKHAKTSRLKFLVGSNCYNDTASNNDGIASKAISFPNANGFKTYALRSARSFEWAKIETQEHNLRSTPETFAGIVLPC